MKTTKILTVMMIATMMVACQSKEETIKEGYLPKASKYVNSMSREKFKDIDTVEFKKFDSIVPLTERDLRGILVQPIYNEWEKENEYFQGMLEVEKKFALPFSEELKQLAVKVDNLNQTYLDSIEVIDKTTNDKKTEMYEVWFTVDYVMKDGSKEKNKPFFVIFDLEGDVSAKYNAARWE